LRGRRLGAITTRCARVLVPVTWLFFDNSNHKRKKQLMLHMVAVNFTGQVPGERGARGPLFGVSGSGREKAMPHRGAAACPDRGIVMRCVTALQGLRPAPSRASGASRGIILSSIFYRLHSPARSKVGSQRSEVVIFGAATHALEAHPVTQENSRCAPAARAFCLLTSVSGLLSPPARSKVGSQRSEVVISGTAIRARDWW
jgi:hypothetical protein